MNDKLDGEALDVLIHLPEKVQLHTGNLDLELFGELYAGSDDGSIFLDGKLYTSGGKYSVADREFIITEGIVVFSPDTGFNPLLDGKAVCRVSDVAVTANVKGSMVEPKISLESYPWMVEEDIRSVIFSENR